MDLWQKKLVRVDMTNGLSEQARKDTITDYGLSHHKFNAFLIGRLAELALHQILNPRASLHANPVYDLSYYPKTHRTPRVVTIDAKGKKRNGDYLPYSYYDASIIDSQKTKIDKPDHYAHLSVNYINDVCVSCYLIGFTTPAQYFNGSEVQRMMGDVDPSNGQKCTIPCWNRKYIDCIQLEDWLKKV